MSGCSPSPPDSCGVDALPRGGSGGPRKSFPAASEVDSLCRRSRLGDETHPSKDTAPIPLPLATEQAGRDPTAPASGAPVVTRCPERWRDTALLSEQAPTARLAKQRLGSTSSVCTHRSCKSTASHIQEVAGDDHCAHCALACLFCEFLALCSLVLEGLGCGALCLAGGCCAGAEPPAQGCGGGRLPLRGGVRAAPGLLRLRRLPGDLSRVLLHLLPLLTRAGARAPHNPTPTVQCPAQPRR
ncbi:uncharacterized protein LOC142826407 [Pelodiscus sinensis]|uniref:uncharacterized protein LOC142826407 n=1 Tax=Pelodiscus sinensis TaxID=13735 RepID=UPI003F6ABD83